MVDDVLKPQVTAIDLEGVYPADVLRRLGAMGGFGGLVDERYGGTGRGLADVIATMSDGQVVKVTREKSQRAAGRSVVDRLRRQVCLGELDRLRLGLAR